MKANSTQAGWKELICRWNGRNKKWWMEFCLEPLVMVILGQTDASWEAMPNVIFNFRVVFVDQQWHYVAIG